MAYIAPIHRPSSVRHALKLRLLSPTEESIVIAKANCLEIWRFTAEDHIYLFHSRKVFGTVSMLQALRPKDSDTELLFVGTDRFEYFTLAWDAAADSLRTEDSFHDVGEKHLRDSQSQDRCLVDPSGRYMALLLWEGVLSLLRMPGRRNKAAPRRLTWMDQIRLPEIFIKASTFLHSETGQPRIAFLYQTQADRPESRLSLYRLTSDDGKVAVSSFDLDKHRELSLHLPDDPGAALLIPVNKVGDDKRYNVRHSTAGSGAGGAGGGGGGRKAHLGGLVVVGETSMLYLDDATQQLYPFSQKSASIYVAWAAYDNTHYFVADDYGVLHLLTISTEGAGSSVVTDIMVTPIGRTSRASCLLYMEASQMLLVGSHNGNSQLFRIDLATETGHYCELVQVLPNIGPILDFSIMDMGHRESDSEAGGGDGVVLASEYSSGQARIVTASGVHKDGSLRSVRSGVGFEDIGILSDDMPGVRGLFSLRRGSASAPASARLGEEAEGASGRPVDTLVASFLTETRVFVFGDDGDIEEVNSYPGLALDTQTLWAANIFGGERLLQITSAQVTVSDTDSGVTVATWTPPAGRAIVSASANSRWALLSVGGTTAVALNLEHDLGVVVEREVGGGSSDQIACVHAAPQPELLDVGVIGLWTSASLSLVDLATLEPRLPGGGSEPLRRRDDADLASVPRSIVLAQLLPPRLSGPTLLVAMDDGHVVSYNVTVGAGEEGGSRGQITLSGRKAIVLGMRHARLHLLPQPGGVYNIFATTEHPSLIYGSDGRIVYAGITADDANFVCPFDAAAFPGAIAVATDSQIKLSRTDTEKQIHVKTMAVGETVRRIAYSPAEKVFALGCVHRELIQGVEVVSSDIKLVDDVVFQPLGRPIPLDGGGMGDGGGGGGVTEMVEAVIRAELTDALGQPVERFLVGTSFISGSYGDDDHAGHSGSGSRTGHGAGNESANTLGRILVLGVDSERSLYVVSAHRMRGPCRSLGVLPDDGLLVIGLSKTVVLARYTETSTMSGQLKRVASYRTATFVVDLAISGRMIAVGDMMKSVALVEYVPAKPAEPSTGDGQDNEDDATMAGEGGAARARVRARARAAGAAPATGRSSPSSEPQLVERARNYQASWSTAVCHVEGPVWLEADGYGNLSVLEQNEAGVTAEDRRQLRVTSEMNLGEMVNRIRPIAVRDNANAMVHPKAFMATVEGSIYMFGTVAQKHQDMLMTFQSRLQAFVKSPGNSSFAAYRGFRNTEREAEEPFRFLDGELLEGFLNLSDEEQAEVAEGLGPSVEDLRDIIEDFKRMH